LVGSVIWLPASSPMNENPSVSVPGSSSSAVSLSSAPMVKVK
jgi:hypothetical protein